MPDIPADSKKRHYTISREISTPFDPLLNKLEILFTEFEITSSYFPPLKLPSDSKKQTSRSTHPQNRETTSSPPIKFQRVSPQLKTESFKAPNIQCFESGIGPGSYKIKEYEIQGGTISESPRFELSSIDKAEQFIKLKKRVNGQLPIIEKNKDLKSLSFEKKTEKLIKIKKLKNFQIEVTKSVKKSLVQSDHQSKLKKYLKKINGIDWKLRKAERKYLKPTWVILMTGITSVLMIRCKIYHRKIFKKSAYHYFCMTVLISKFIGKMKRVLYKYRLKRLRFSLLKNVTKLKIWINRKKKKHKNAVLDIVENFSLSSSMTVFLMKFIKSVVCIQRAYKEMIKLKRYRLRLIHELFLRHRSSIIKKIYYKHPYISFREYELQNNEAYGFLRHCFVIYYKKYKLYKLELKEHQQNKQETLTIDPNFKDFDPEPQKPFYVVYSNFQKKFERYLKKIRLTKTGK